MDSNQTDWWQSCVSAALIGTDRRVPPLPKGEDALSQLVRSLDWNQPAAALLSAAGATTQYRRVGQSAKAAAQAANLPAEGFDELVPCEPDVLPCCSDRIAQHLNTALQHYPEAVPELLELMASVGQRVPPKCLPNLLIFGQKNPDAHTAIRSVLGNRGRWLTEQNPDWRYACYPVGSAEEADLSRVQQQWQIGEKKERAIAFSQWRTTEPDGARDALESCWKQESWRDRERFIQALSIHLSKNDEPFLEQALADRAQGVRTQAAMLLSQLSGSELCQRMTQRVQSFVQLQQKGKKLEIELNLPEQFDSTWARDGIQKKPRNGEGERAGWVRQMLVTTPLSVWKADPQDIVKVATAHEWREALVNGWAGAIQRQKHDEVAKPWAVAWLNQCGAYDLDESIVSDLLRLLSPTKRESYLRAQLPQPANDQSLAHWLRLVAQASTRWDFEFSRLVLSQLLLLLQSKPKYGDLFSPPISLALSLHPGLAAEAAQRVANLPAGGQHWTNSWQKFLDRFLGLLSLRWEVYQAFVNSS